VRERDEKCLHVRGVWETRTGGMGREERWGKNGKDNHQEAGGGGRKKLISMKIIGKNIVIYKNMVYLCHYVTITIKS